MANDQTKMLKTLLALLGGKPSPAQRGPRARLTAETWPAAIYAIGDVHGCLDELRQLEERIVEDGRELAGEKWLVMLGDYIDRGPQSAQTVAHLMADPPAGFRRICLCGNHEQMLLDFLEDPAGNSGWLSYGGVESARSYGMVGLDPLRMAPPSRVAAGLVSLIPERHLRFLRELPVSLALPGYHFVHAGMRPGIAPEEQSHQDLMWIREPFLELDRKADAIVVHGHTPTDQPEIRPWRIGVDTGVFASGRLTAVRLVPGHATSFLQTSRVP